MSFTGDNAGLHSILLAEEILHYWGNLISANPHRGACA